jgi:hypothetical protein
MRRRHREAVQVLKIEITMAGSEFEADPLREAGRMLRRFGERLEGGARTMPTELWSSRVEPMGTAKVTTRREP